MDMITEWSNLKLKYWKELQDADVRGKYNAVFKTYSTTQRDVHAKYKGLFATLKALADDAGVELKGNAPTDTLPEEPKHEVLG